MGEVFYWREDLRCALRVVVKDQQLIWLNREFRVRLSIIVRELNFVSARKRLNHRTHLATHKTTFRDIPEKSYNVQ